MGWVSMHKCPACPSDWEPQCSCSASSADHVVCLCCLPLSHRGPLQAKMMGKKVKLCELSRPHLLPLCCAADLPAEQIFITHPHLRRQTQMLQLAHALLPVGTKFNVLMPRFPR
jgi:hypothetical protein